MLFKSHKVRLQYLDKSVNPAEFWLLLSHTAHFHKCSIFFPHINSRKQKQAIAQLQLFLQTQYIEPVKGSKCLNKRKNKIVFKWTHRNVCFIQSFSSDTSSKMLISQKRTVHCGCVTHSSLTPSFLSSSIQSGKTEVQFFLTITKK